MHVTASWEMQCVAR